MRPKRPKGKCAIPACWEQEEVAGFCKACYSWWGRVQLYTAGELGTYLKRLDRFASRAGRAQRLGGGRRRKAA